MAKKFFYVCSGICLLALSYHLGAGSARAQVGFGLTSATVQEHEGYFAAVGADRVPHIANRSGSNSAALDGVATMAPVPGTAEVIAVHRTGISTPSAYAILSNGDVYCSLDGFGWTFSGNLTGAATPVTSTSWGKVKADYRK